jgi:streptogramin lyase
MACSRVSTCVAALLPFLLTLACGDTGSESGSASASATGATNPTSSATATPTGEPASSSGVPTTSGASDSAATGSTTIEPTSTGTAESGGIKFDLPNPDGGSDTGGLCGCGNDLGFSYIWIANTNNSTLTKLNTQTMAEEGRYLTRADAAGSPSRTSVSISGRGVVVANRNGGVTKVLARHEDCDELKNGQPGLQTSSGKDDVLAWDQDDCVAWHTPFPYTTQRPVAWMAGTLNQATCLYEDEKVWTGGCQEGVDTWVWVNRLNGDTGAIEDSIQIVGFECSSLSPYGGAVDSKGNFWMTSLVPGQDRMARVDAETLEFEVQTPPITPYGMTVDTKDRPWLASWLATGGASAARYDPVTATWALATNHVANVMSGIQEDAKGRMWMNYWNYDNTLTGGVIYIDRETMEVSEPFEINPCERRGMSIDLDGNVWSTSMGCNQAYRFNPDTKVITTYDQLDGPYTYSDMTGWALQNNTCNNPNG